MKTTQRNYTEESGDFNRIAHFIIAHSDHVRTYSTWCLGRFVDWRYGLWGNKPTIPDFWGKNARLWFDGFGDLAGLAISENGGPDFTLLTAPGYRFLCEDMLQWVLSAWRDRGPALETEISAAQVAEAEMLEQCGFHREAIFYSRCFDLTRMPETQVTLEPGFAIVDMHTHPDYRQQRLLRANAFRNMDAYTDEQLRYELSLDEYARQHSPIYHPLTDLCVMAPDGQFVSGCEALIDARNAVADIERICTHSHFRRRGFARAVIRECMARLRALEIRTVYIAGYSPEAIALYGSLGHVEESQSFAYKL